MTTIVFYKANGFYYGFEEQGHTGYGESGDDVLCAALSSMTMLIINAIEVSYACDVDYNIDIAVANNFLPLVLGIAVLHLGQVLENAADAQVTGPDGTDLFG